MARVFSNVIGNFSGKLGNLSARIRFGSTILSARPASFNAPNDPAAIERRSLFLATIRFALQVAELPVLKAIWEKAKPLGISAINHMVSTNYQYTSPTRPTVDNKITPGGFALGLQNALLDADKLTAVVPAITGMTTISPEEVHCSFNAVICYHTPLVPGDAPYNLVSLSKLVPNYQFGQQYNLQLDLDVLQKAIAAKYDSSIIYIAAATKTADEKIMRNSGTFSQAF